MLYDSYHFICLLCNFFFCNGVGAFTGFDKSPFVIIPPTKQSVVDFVELIYENTLIGFYFMHDRPIQLTLMEDGAPIHRSRYLDDWRQAHGIKKIMKDKDEMIQIIQQV